MYQASGIGNLSIPDLTYFTPTTDPLPQANDQYGTAFNAHRFGEIGSSYKYSQLPETSIEGSPWASNPAAYWNATDHWVYISLNSTPSNFSNGPGPVSIYSNRVIKSSGICTLPSYSVSDSPNRTRFVMQESGEIVNFPPEILGGAEGTWYRSTSSTFTDSACGLGCGNVKVVEASTGLPAPGSYVGDKRIYFYDCNITVTIQEGIPGGLSADQASTAARAIALSGALPGSNMDGDWDYVFYPLSAGQAQYNSVTGMASQISRYAIGVVAAAAQINVPKTIQGRTPTQGLRLHLDNPLAYGMVLGFTAGVQLLLVVFTATMCRGIYIPDEMLLSRRETLKRFCLPS